MMSFHLSPSAALYVSVGIAQNMELLRSVTHVQTIPYRKSSDGKGVISGPWCNGPETAHANIPAVNARSAMELQKQFEVLDVFPDLQKETGPERLDRKNNTGGLLVTGSQLVQNITGRVGNSCVSNIIRGFTNQKRHFALHQHHRATIARLRLSFCNFHRILTAQATPSSDTEHITQAAPKTIVFTFMFFECFWLLCTVCQLQLLHLRHTQWGQAFRLRHRQQQNRSNSMFLTSVHKPSLCHDPVIFRHGFASCSCHKLARSKAMRQSCF